MAVSERSAEFAGDLCAGHLIGYTNDNTQTNIASIPVAELQIMTINATINDYSAAIRDTLTAVVVVHLMAILPLWAA